MFGLLRPCRHHLGVALHRQWRSHLCGLCLTLRDSSGQVARVTTNVDAVLLSVLVEAQMPEWAERAEAGRCPLRGMQKATVVAPSAAPAAYGAAVSLTMAAVKVADHVDDGDGWPGRLRQPSRRLARRWERQGVEIAGTLGFDTSVLSAEAGRQGIAESAVGRSVWDYASPTARAAAEAFSHTAVLAGQTDNAIALRRAGEAYGRIVYLLDAVEDRVADGRAGRFNALDAARGTPDPAALFDDAHRDLVAALSDVTMARPALARALLVDELARVGRRRTGRPVSTCATHARTALGLGAAAAAIAAMPLPSGGDPLPPGFGPPPGIGDIAVEEQKRHWYSGCCDGGCCDCGDCACCCCDCSDCDCDCCSCDC